MRKYISILLAVSLVSCSKFLEPKSENEYVPETAAALNELLIGSAYPQAGGAGGSVFLDNYHGVFDDDMTCTGLPGTLDQYGNGNVSVRLMAMYSWQPDVFEQLREVNYSQNVWAGHYDYILGANAALDYIDDVRGTADEKNHVKAQALALRAYYYFDLVNMFGAPYNHDKNASGVPLKTTSAMEKLELSRNTVDEVYTQVLEDLDEAERLYELLPAALQYRADYRTSLPMVQLLKSRVYLYMENWEQSAVYASKVIGDWPQFELKDLNTVATTTAVPHFSFISIDNRECIWLFGSVNNFLAFFSINATYTQPTSGYRNFFRASPALLDSYGAGDLREELYIIRNNDDLNAGEDERTSALAMGKHPVSSERIPIGSNYFARAFRLAEAYLNLAEAAAMDDDPSTALKALNDLRRTRYTPATYEEITGLSGDALVERIRLERRLELCFEGHRWFDLRRYGMPSFSRVWRQDGEDVRTYTLAEKDPFYTWPIPEEVLIKNRNLAQNPLPAPRNQ